MSLPFFIIYFVYTFISVNVRINSKNDAGISGCKQIREIEWQDHNTHTGGHSLQDIFIINLREIRCKPFVKKTDYLHSAGRFFPEQAHRRVFGICSLFADILRIFIEGNH